MKNKAQVWIGVVLTLLILGACQSASLEKKDESVLDEFYYLNKEDPNYSICRATVNRGKDAELGGKFGLSRKGCMEIMKLFFTADE